jgi:hypothetical protein
MIFDEEVQHVKLIHDENATDRQHDVMGRYGFEWSTNI